MRICLVYDCLFPWTIGGAERWYRELGERLAAAGHDVTYLTQRQWDRDAPPEIPGVRVVAVAPRMALYTGSGRRRTWPPVVFGAGVLAHLARHGRRYDAVHTCSFPYFSLLAAGLARRAHSFALVVDWFEVWSAEYWREYLGRAGAIGLAIQRTCARIPQRAFCFSRLHAARLREEGLRSEPTLLTGLHAGGARTPDPAPSDAEVVFAGRHIPEKRVPAIVGAIARAREQAPDLRATVFGDGPDRPALLEAIAREDAGAFVAAPGFVDSADVEAGLRRALCMLLPSRREGYGMVVAEAASLGTPSVVVAGPDNAATELVEDGVNGFVARSADPEDLAEAILRVRAGGAGLRRATSAWYGENAGRLSVTGSLDRAVAAYARLAPSARS